MLGYGPYYYQTIRKVIAGFGSIFNGLTIVKYDLNTRAELARVPVPLIYEGKETYATRLLGDPSANRGTQVNLPSMSYEYTGIKYNSLRKLSPFEGSYLPQPQGTLPILYTNGVPYDVFINLYLYVRNMEDGFQVIEQIIPFFQPSYTLNMKYILAGTAIGNTNWISEAMPITLQDINFQNEYDGPQGTVRQITWSLNFTAQALFFGPQPAAGGPIKEVIINFNDPDAANGQTVATVTASVDPPSANGPGPNVNTIIAITESA